MVPTGAPVGESDIHTCAILSPHIVGAGPEEDQDDYNEAQHYWKLILRGEIHVMKGPAGPAHLMGKNVSIWKLH